MAPAARSDASADGPRQLELFAPEPAPARTARPRRPVPPPPVVPAADAEPPVGSRPVADALPLFERWLVGSGKAEHTIASFLSDLRQLAAFYPTRPLDQLSTSDLQLFLGHQRRDRGLAPSSIERKTAALKSFFGFLFAQGLVPHDPARRLIYPDYAPTLPDVLSDAEVARLLEVTRDRPLWHALVATLRYTGAKREEALALQRRDVVLDGPAPAVALRKRRPSRYGRDRVVPLVEPLRTILRAYLATLEGPLLFPLHVRSVAWGLDEYARRAGISVPVSAQTLRDTFAVAWLRERLPAERALRAAGHLDEELALRAQHDRQLLDLLGLADRTAAETIARYRALAGPVA